MGMNGVKICPTCKLIKMVNCFWKDRTRADGLDYRCSDCHKKLLKTVLRRRQTKESQKKYIEANKDKYKAHQVINNLVKDGKITSQPCFLCGEIKTEGHHLLYEFPEKVIWLCRKHHAKVEYYAK